MYVYIRSEPNLYTVGFYDPQGQWHPESDWNTTKQAADRVAWLNGGNLAETVEALETKVQNLGQALTEYYITSK